MTEARPSTGDPGSRSGRGMLIAQEDFETLSSRSVLKERLSLRWRGLIVVMISLGLGAWATMLVGTLEAYIALLVVGAVLGLTYLIMFFAFSPDPVTASRVYENGVLVPKLLGGPRFIPWHRFNFWEQVRSSDRPAVFLATGQGIKVKIMGTMPDYNEVTNRIKGILKEQQVTGAMVRVHLRKLAKPEAVRDEEIEDFVEEELEERGLIHEPTEEDIAAIARKARRQIYYFFLIVGVLSTIIIFVFFTFLINWPNTHRAVAVVMAYFACGMFFLPVWVSWYFSRNRVQKYRIDVKRWAVYTVIAGLVLFGGFFAMYDAQHPDIWKTDTEADMSSDPGGSFIAMGEHFNETITVPGPVTVRSGQTLRLVNSSLRFDPTPGTEYGIWVEEGGRLIMTDTLVECADPFKGFTFEVQGSAIIEGCRIISTSKSWDPDMADSGLEIHSDDVHVLNTTFQFANHDAMVIYKCSPLIEGCSFVEAEEDGIEVVGGTPVIRDCMFLRCGWGIQMRLSDAKIINCTFDGNMEGIHFRWGSPVISHCHFANNTYEAIDYGSDESPVIEGNTYYNNRFNATARFHPDDLYFIVLTLLYFTPLMFTGFVLFERWKKRRRKELKWERELREHIAEHDRRIVEGYMKETDGEEDTTLMNLKCPKCGTINTVDVSERPLEFCCEQCETLMRIR